MNPCLCHDPYQCCEVHDPMPPYISVNDRLNGCDCPEVKSFGMLLRSLLCPLHGAPAYRPRAEETEDSE